MKQDFGLKKDDIKSMLPSNNSCKKSNFGDAPGYGVWDIRLPSKLQGNLGKLNLSSYIH